MKKYTINEICKDAILTCQVFNKIIARLVGKSELEITDPAEQLVCWKMSDVLEKEYHIDFIDNKLIRK